MTDENTDPQTAGTEPTVPDWLLPNRAYDVLKWVALIVLPAIGVLRPSAPYGAGRGPIRPRRPSTPSP